jgi:SAM-dependent methyltransferase
MPVTGLAAQGIEPRREMARQTRAKGLALREGYFCGALATTDRFDVIVFNDVLEHIPGLHAILSACHYSLDDNGILMIKLPAASGVCYRLSTLPARNDASSMFERMWQLHHRSPHLHYFRPGDLKKLVMAHEFDHLLTTRLESLVAGGLFERIAHTREYPFPVAHMIHAAARLSIPLLGILPRDTRLQILRRGARPPKS